MPTRKSTATTTKSPKSPKNKRASGGKSPKTGAKPAPSRKKKKVAKKEQSEDEVTIDRRRKDRRDDEAAQEESPKLERREKVNRRRQIDPTTCERDYSEQEVEFMNALDDYKRKSGRMFPTCSEVLEVIRELGYVQLTAAEMAARRPLDDSEATEVESPIAEASSDDEFEPAGLETVEI